MTPGQKTVAVGAAAGFVAWGFWFYRFTKREEAALAAYAEQAAAPIAEEAAKAYIADTFGLTPAIMARIQQRAGLLTNLADSFRS